MAKPVSLHALFFPGIVFHEFSHYLACLLFGVKVKRVKWFGKEDAYVVHETPQPLASVVITLAPFLLGNWLAYNVLEAATPLLGAGGLLSPSTPLALFYYWFALALLYYSFPSDQDGSNAFYNVLGAYRKGIFGSTPAVVKLLYLVTFPLAFLPLVFALGFMMLFSNSAGLRIIWTLSIVLLSFDPSLGAQFGNLFNGLASTVTRLFVGFIPLFP
ncbi:MAG: hypothetical protein J4203_04385 [Candidatus Diapherotrites archaeon]|uniref:DUF3267 domain-containing protein n=2 Tax=Candidatus Iainarchaeum sp. TaxID=3101447 RepID=A0A8T4LJN1_9ARCH|nr:hypothetical protein [Candidatus Diapherotrites archaeon]